MEVTIIWATQCPMCYLFMHGDGYSGYDYIRELAHALLIPIGEVNIADEDYETLRLDKGTIKKRSTPKSPHKTWIARIVDPEAIEIPGLLIRSDLAKTRYVQIEIANEVPGEKSEVSLVAEYEAARQGIRNIARTGVEEHLVAHRGFSDYETVQYIMDRVFPDERGSEEPDVAKWVKAFNNLRYMRVKGE